LMTLPHWANTLDVLMSSLTAHLIPLCQSMPCFNGQFRSPSCLVPGQPPTSARGGILLHRR
jgi:hypothetical protein